MDALIYISVSWILSAIVSGCGHGLQITTMLPLASAICLAHFIFQSRRSLPGIMALAITLGYLEDIHQGMPPGTLTLAYLAAAMLLMWAQRRLSLDGPWRSMITIFILVLFIDLFTWAILLVLADVLAFNPTSLRQALTTIHWHALATLLATPFIWFLLDRLFAVLTRFSGLISYGPTRPSRQNSGILS